MPKVIHPCRDLEPCHFWNGENESCKIHGKDRAIHMLNGGTMTCKRVAKLGMDMLDRTTLVNAGF